MDEDLKQIMADVLGVSVDKIGEDASMKTIPDWDSLKHMEIIVAIEEHYGFPPLTADEIVSMTSMEGIKRVLAGKLPGSVSYGTPR